jgi:hypothetical protein
MHLCHRTMRIDAKDREEVSSAVREFSGYAVSSSTNSPKIVAY